tara:strand:+ start:6380 stop:7111 length:732 start_codon:yes stop_codon:yes gene_type:complete
MSNQASAVSHPNTDIIVALDVPTKEEAFAILDRLENRPRCVKIGLQLFTRYGPSLVESVASRGCRIFLDLKLHDIPNTVAHAVESLAHLPIDLLTIHCLGGPAMIRAAAEARDRSGSSMKLLAVTILTSMDEEQIEAVGLSGSPSENAIRLAGMALESGADGLVCSALEVQSMRNSFGSDPILVVPGIRPSGFAKGDQKRVMTPGEAAQAGSTHLVIGRPIVKAEDPVSVYDQIAAEILATTQ